MKQTVPPIFVRSDPKLRNAIKALQDNTYPIPRIADIVRQAVMEKYEREVKQKRRRNE